MFKSIPGYSQSARLENQPHLAALARRVHTRLGAVDHPEHDLFWRVISTTAAAAAAAATATERFQLAAIVLFAIMRVRWSVAVRSAVHNVPRTRREARECRTLH